MSQGNLSGNSDWDATERTLHVLQKMSHPPTSVIQALQYALKIQKNLLFKTGIAHRVQRDVKKLEPGQSVAVPSSAKGHAMMMMITCVGKKPSGEKRYTVVQHNTGAGIANYHYYNRSMNGRPKYQTALEITDVSEEALCGHSSRFFSRLFALEESPVKKLYTKVIPLLRGTIAPPSSDPRLWSHGQIGGSCSASCGLSLIRSQLDRETFKEFRERSRIEMILESFQQIKEGGESSTDQKIVTLEVVRKLMHIYDRRGLPLPKELEETKKQLEEISSQSSQKIASFEKALLQKGLIKRTLHGQPFEVVDDGTGKLYGKDSADNINIAFSLIREGNFSQESLELAVKYIEKAVSLRTGLPCTQEENEKLLNIGFSMTSMLKDRPLTAEQMYVATAMTALAFDAIPTIRESRSIKKNLTELENFAVNLQNSFLALNKRAYDHRPILDSLILNQQDRLFGSSSSYQQIHTPSGMTYLKQRMEKNRHTAEGA